MPQCAGTDAPPLPQTWPPCVKVQPGRELRIYLLCARRHILARDTPLDDARQAVPAAKGTVAKAPSLRLNSLASLLQQIVGFVSALGLGVITARALGPAGKGVLATLTLLVLLGTHLGGAGFGEAAIVEAAKGRSTLQHILRATVAAVAVTSTVASGLLLVVGFLVFRGDIAATARPLLLGVACLVFGVYFTALQQLLNASERVVLTSGLTALASIVTLLSAVAFLIVLQLGIDGAMLAMAAASIVGLTGTAVALHRSGLSLGARWDWAYVRRAAKFGSVVQAAYLVGALAGRADLLLVYLLDGKADAGFYSVALTVGGLTGYFAWAVSYASFPRLALLGHEAAQELTLRVCRVGLAGATFSAVGLLLVTPIALPLAFGEAFRPAVIPSLILIPGGVIACGQVLLCRALAARGDAHPLLLSFTVSLSVMVLADLAAIPIFGMVGAAGVSTGSAFVGLWAVVTSMRRRGSSEISLSQLAPRREDFLTVLGLAGRYAGAMRLRICQRR